MTAEIWNYILGGGLLALVVGIVTLGAKIKEANAKAEQAVAEAKRMLAEAKGSELNNDEKTLQIFKQYIYEPIQKEVTSLRRVINRFTRAIDKINDCPYAATCPVRHELQNSQECHADCPIATDGTEK